MSVTMIVVVISLIVLISTLTVSYVIWTAVSELEKMGEIDVEAMEESEGGEEDGVRFIELGEGEEA